MGRKHIVPRGHELIAMFRAEPMLTCLGLAARYSVSGEAARLACKASGVTPSKIGRPAIVPAEPVAAPVEQAPLDPVATVLSMFAVDPALTAARIMGDLDVSHATAYRLVKKAGIVLRNPLRMLPDDKQLAAEIREFGQSAVAEMYDTTYNIVNRHAVRLRVSKGAAHNRKLPPDEILSAELDVLSTAEIAQRYQCSANSVAEARRRLKGYIRGPHKKPAIVGTAAVPLLSTAIAHLHAYRGILAAIDPARATALLDDIEQLSNVAQAITTIAALVAERSA